MRTLYSASEKKKQNFYTNLKPQSEMRTLTPNIEAHTFIERESTKDEIRDTLNKKIK